MKRTFAIGVMLMAFGGVLAAPVPAVPPVANKPRAPEAGDFVFRSVLEGLTEDGVPPLLAQDLEKRPDFLGKCPLCTPTHRALTEYATRTDAARPKPGKGLPVDLAKRLGVKDDDVRRSALRELVAGYVERGYARSELSPEQRASLEKDLLQMRGKPKNTGDGLKFCPSCDGACRLLPKK